MVNYVVAVCRCNIYLWGCVAIGQFCVLCIAGIKCSSDFVEFLGKLNEISKIGVVGMFGCACHDGLHCCCCRRRRLSL
jgi:hypothetical protein